MLLLRVSSIMVVKCKINRKVCLSAWAAVLWVWGAQQPQCQQAATRHGWIHLMLHVHIHCFHRLPKKCGSKRMRTVMWRSALTDRDSFTTQLYLEASTWHHDPTDLDDDEFLLFGFLVRPVLPKTEVDLKGWRVLSFTFLKQDQTYGQKNMLQSHLLHRTFFPLHSDWSPCRKSLRLNTLIFFSLSIGFGGPCSGMLGPDQNTLHWQRRTA